MPGYSARRFADGPKAIGDGVTGTPIESDGGFEHHARSAGHDV